MRWLLEVDGRLGAVLFDQFSTAAQTARFLNSVGHVAVVVGVQR